MNAYNATDLFCILKYAHLLTQYLMKEGLSFEDACDTLNLPKKSLNSVTFDDRISAVDFVSACNKLIEFTGDELACIKAGSDNTTSDFDILSGYLYEHATLRDCWESYLEIFDLLENFGKPEFRDMSSDLTGIMHEVPAESVELFSNSSELRIAGRINFSRVMTNYQLPNLINEVHFQHSNKAGSYFYEKKLKCKVLFNQKETGIVYCKKDMNFPVVSPDNQLKSIFLEKIKWHGGMSGCSFYRLVMNVITKRFPDNISQTDIADNLKISISTLKRNLKREGYTYQQAIDDAKLDAAKKMLLEKEISISSIAQQLGYSSISSFSQFFRRVEGFSPNTYRKNIRHN